MMIFVRPISGPVFDPVTQRPLAKEGQLVEKSSYWIRRIVDKDVEIVENNISKETQDEVKEHKVESKKQKSFGGKV